jgi:hypothetical protein
MYQARIGDVAVLSVAGEATKDRTLLAMMCVSGQPVSSDTYLAVGWLIGTRPSRAAKYA